MIYFDIFREARFEWHGFPEGFEGRKVQKPWERKEVDKGSLETEEKL